MENLSEPAEAIAIPLVISVPAYLRDHHVGGRVVLPAVEALQIAARSLPPGEEGGFRLQEEAIFRHPLIVNSGSAEIRVLHEFGRYADGRCLSRLTTLRSGRQMKFTRRMEHLSVWFSPADREDGGYGAWCREGRGAGRDMVRGEGVETVQPPEPARVRPSGPGGDSGLEPDFLPDSNRIRRTPSGSEDNSGAETDFPMDPDDAFPHAGPTFRVSADRLYGELVPFGPAYRNVRGDVFLTETCVLATVFGGDFPEAAGPLGSPFPLDAAMHAACAWGQRYRNRVVFPVGFNRREILSPTRAGETYFCLITPLPDEGDVLRFDVRLQDRRRRPVEMIRGLKMRDIFGGKRTPPAWVREGLLGCA